MSRAMVLIESAIILPLSSWLDVRSVRWPPFSPVFPQRESADAFTRVEVFGIEIALLERSTSAVVLFT